MSESTGNVQPQLDLSHHDATGGVNTKRVFLYGWDADNLVKRRIATNSDGNIKVNLVGSPTFTNQSLTGYIDFTEISTPSNPSANHGRLYGKDFDGNTLPFWLDESGNEYDLTGGGGGGGVTTFLGLTDTPSTYSGSGLYLVRVNAGATALEFASTVPVGQGGTNISSYTAGDILYATGATTLTKLAVGAENKYLRSTGLSPFWDDAMDLDTNQTVGGVKTFTSLPLSSGVPTTGNQLVNKTYADSLASGFLFKEATDVATTGNITLSGEQTIDGYSAVTGDRVLVKDQSTGSQNGVYVVAAGAWSRATDYDQDAEVTQGTAFLVLNGTVNGSSQWALLTDGAIVGTTALVFTQISAPTTYTAGDGLDLVGTEFSLDLKANDGLAIKTTELGVDYDDSTIGIVSNKLAVKSSGITNTQINDVAASKITGQVGLTQGGTGLSAAGTGNYILGMNSGGSALEYKQLVEGSNITITHGANSVTIASSGGGGGGGGGGETMLDVDVVSASQTAQTWTNMPSATTELFGNVFSRIKVDLSNATEYRIVVNQSVAGYRHASGTPSADFNLQYSTDNSTYTAADTGGAGELDVGTGTGVKVGSWASLVSGAKADVWLRLVGKDGNGAVDPAFRQIRIQFKILAGAPNTAQYVTLATDSTLPNERVLTGTSNQITLTDNGAGSTVVLSTPQNIHTGATPTFAGMNIGSAGAIDFASGDITLTHSTNLLTMDGASLTMTRSDSGIALNIRGLGTNSIEIGRIDGSSSTPFIDFHSGATAVDHDVRLLASGGTGSNGGGSLVLTAAAFRPNTNDGSALGAATVSWSDLFLASGAVINFANGNTVLTHSTGEVTVTTGNWTVLGTANNSLKFDNAGTAPNLTAGGSITNRYGGNSNFLGDPVGWALVNIAGTDRVIPFYTPGA